MPHSERAMRISSWHPIPPCRRPSAPRWLSRKEHAFPYIFHSEHNWPGLCTSRAGRNSGRSASKSRPSASPTLRRVSLTSRHMVISPCLLSRRGCLGRRSGHMAAVLDGSFRPDTLGSTTRNTSCSLRDRRTPTSERSRRGPCTTYRAGPSLMAAIGRLPTQRRTSSK